MDGEQQQEQAEWHRQEMAASMAEAAEAAAA
jgi:hypothetical protein